MGIPEMVLIGLALSMDAFAVTLSNVFVYPQAARLRLLILPVAFGVFQGLMPLLGYFIGSLAAGLFEQFAGIVSLLILAFIGGKMVWEGFGALKADKEAATGTVNTATAQLTLMVILAQAVATSLDAFIVGVSFLAQGASIALAAPIVAVVTCLCCLIALAIGKRFGVLLGAKAQIVGGAILIFIGLRIFLF